MAVDWAARLDASGKHVVPTKRHDISAKFSGETRQVTDAKGTWTEADEMIVFDPEDEGQQLRVRVGDAVYLTGARKGSFAEIVRVDSIFMGMDNSLYIFNTFYWRPEHLKHLLPDTETWESEELFLQETADDAPNSVSAIELVPVRVTEHANFEAAPHTFFQRRTYNAGVDQLSKLPDVPTEEPQPMDADDAAPAPAPAPAPSRSCRNVAAERDGRIAELEATVAELQGKLAQMDLLANTVRELEAKVKTLIDNQ